MPLFIFHFCKADGSSPSFEAFEHRSEAAACAHGAQLLGEHLSCTYISIWQAESQVARVDRRAPLPLVVTLRSRARTLA